MVGARYSPPTVRGWDTLTVLRSVDLLGTVTSGASTAVAYPLANLAIFVPFSVAVPVTVFEGWANVGSTAGGNFDIGVYDESGNRLTSSGATARVVSTVVDTTTMTNLDLAPNRRYYMGFAADSTNIYHSISPAAGVCEAHGVCEQTSAYVLPNPATMVVTTRAYVPAFGLNLYTVELG